MATEATEKSVPLTAQAQEAKEVMQQQLMRKMASKMIDQAIEEERARRIRDEKEAHEDTVRQKAFDQLIVVQEDLVRCLNRMKVKAAEELEQGQRITTDKKYAVHEELMRKANAKQVKQDEEAERERRIEESKDEHSQINMERQKTYDRLVLVQEDLLHTIQTMRVDEEMKKEQQRRITEDRKLTMQEQLVHEVGKKQAAVALDVERERRVEEMGHLSEEDAKRRLEVAYRMLDVQKELLATHTPTKPIVGTLSQEVLEEAKVYMQEQLLRKAAQKEALAAMDEEQQRRVKEAPLSPVGGVSDAQVEMLEQITRRASQKKAREMEEQTRQGYILAEQKARSQEATVRKVHQKQADHAMDQEQHDRVEQMDGKAPPSISPDLKRELLHHPHSPK